jgi:endonuclease YncB( thermonuclease family)
MRCLRHVLFPANSRGFYIIDLSLRIECAPMSASFRYFLYTVFAVGLFCSSPALADISGPARIVDGDTIWIGKTKIRLYGIDTPEMKQTCQSPTDPDVMCGRLAKQALISIIGDLEVRCEQRDRDRYKRIIAVCYVGSLDINREMVTRGWALAYRKYSRDYIADEGAARKRQAGLWGMKFIPPWEWRRQK